MKKTLLLLAILFGMVTVSFAQRDSTSKLAIGLDYGRALSPTNKLYTSSTGVAFKFEFPFKHSNLNLTLTAAYDSYNTQSNSQADTMQNGHYIPLSVGLKYYLHQGIYIEGDVGESFNINSGYMGYQTAFYYSPAAGYSLPISKNTAAIDFSLRYESRLENDGDINQVALRVAYKFGL